MPKTRFIMVRVTRTQYERVVNKAEALGHKTLSSFIRSSLLGNDLTTEERIKKIFDTIVKEEPPKLQERTLKYHLSAEEPS